MSSKKRKKLHINFAEAFLQDIVYKNPSPRMNTRLSLEMKDDWELIDYSEKEIELLVSRSLLSQNINEFLFKVSVVLILNLDTEKTENMSKKSLQTYIDDNASDVINPSGVMETISYTIASVSLAYNNNAHFTPPIFLGKTELERIEQLEQL